MGNINDKIENDKIEIENIRKECTKRYLYEMGKLYKVAKITLIIATLYCLIMLSTVYVNIDNTDTDIKRMIIISCLAVIIFSIAGCLFVKGIIRKGRKTLKNNEK